MNNNLNCAGCTKAPANDVWFSLKTSLREEDFSSKFVEVSGTEVSKFDLLEVGPDSLVGIEIRGVSGQPLELDALCGASGEKLSDSDASVCRRAIPDDEELASDEAKELYEERDDTERVD